MPIAPLPDATVRRLGSTLAISTPAHLIKELLDNAIDSAATTVAVLISSDTVDRIEVRDNGHGIHNDDFDSLGRPAHTSKLRAFAELDTIGGSSLGFRGMALASVNTLAEVTITTRVSTDPVATTLLLLDGGGVTRQGHKAAQVGTTICVSKLFSKFPVRLRTIMKEAHKTIHKIKELLQSYALARHEIKLMFKVLGDPHPPWVYTPKPTAHVREAVIQLFGAELAFHCTLEVFPNTEPATKYSFGVSNPTAKDAVAVRFEGFMPCPGAKLRKSDTGAFFCVDSRPVLSTRGTPKKLLALFRGHFAQFISATNSMEAPKDPFIWLNIQCPPGSYDINVEPAKDDVLFVNEQYVVDQFQEFLLSVYPISKENAKQQRGGSMEPVRERTPPGTPNTPDDTFIQPWTVDMSMGLDAGDDDIDDPIQRAEIPSSITLASNQSSSPERRHDGPAMESLNPWSIAAMSAAPRRETSTHTSAPRAPKIYTPEPKQIQRRSAPQTLALGSENDYPSSKYTLVGQAPPGRTLIPPQRQLDVTAARSRGKLLTKVPGGEYRKPAPAIGMVTAKTGRQQRGLGLHGPSQPSHDIGHSQRLTRDQPPLYSPDSDGLVQSRISFSSRKTQWDREEAILKHGHRSNSLDIHTPVAVREGISIVRSLNTELPQTHKRSTSQEPSLQRHGVYDLARRDPIGPYEAGVLVAEKQEEEHSRTSLPTEDSRAYLIKRQRSIAQHPQKRFRRLRTNMLPLETIFPEFKTTTLVLAMQIESHSIRRKIERARPFDTYLIDGELGVGLEGELDLGLEYKVMALLSSIGYEESKTNPQPSSSMLV
ncbi:hypothetical protein B0T25DRAFT_19871 [Lasiosphaeria hispida]|uniref:DNA mismatch repair protein S5 domain-containing protein n=1 Tax=Lasiosphaeria hispida TaxID=260671 RepID=A0AAJ0HUA1_9PEZI|nr:hypothetical protein B0T25DRAFT_19871 [Lasiosphaeria hispida]